MIGVLVAIDDRVLREALCAAFEREGDFSVVECSPEGVTGVELAALVRPEVVVTSDAPQQAAREVVAGFREASPASRIVLLLRAARTTDLFRNAGADAAVDAAEGLGELVAAVRSVARS